jgi:carbonic anhydrase/acetyltransferase-like protein (isoleucine patch superfamily)
MPTILPFRNIHPKIHESVFLCDGACIIGDVVLEKDVSVWFNTVIRGDVNYIRVGERTNIQDNCVLHVTYKKYPLIVGAAVTVGHSAILHACTIKDDVLIGMGAKILDNALVNSNSLIAAGALVRENFVVPEGVLVAGVPAKIIRELTGDEIKKVKQGAKNYVKYVEQYRKPGENVI